MRNCFLRRTTLVCFLAAAAARGQAAQETGLRTDDARPIAARSGVRLEIRASPLSDQFFDALVRAGEPPAAPGEPDADPARIAAAALQHELGSPLAWGPIEALLSGAADAKTFLARVRELPERFAVGTGANVALREGAVRLAEALVAGEAGFQERVWPAHAKAIGAARERIEKGLLARADACYARLAREFGFDGLALEIPVELVFRAPFPGAVTQRDAQGKGVCFVAVDGIAGAQLDETVLHETIHALDVAAPKSVLSDLRDRLRAAGFGPRDRELRDVPHTLMFVEAAAVIRSEVDPAHEDYGDVGRYYAKIPSAALVKEAWTAHVEGRSTRDEALAKIVEGVAAGREKK